MPNPTLNLEDVQSMKGCRADGGAGRCPARYRPAVCDQGTVDFG